MELQSGKKNRLTLYIGIALVLGIALGFIFNKTYVGEENSRIANADTQAKHLLEKMKAFEMPKDSVAFAALSEQQKKITEQKKAVEQNLLNT